MKDTKGIKFNALGKIWTVHRVHPMSERQLRLVGSAFRKAFLHILPGLHGENRDFQAFQMRDLG